MLPTLSRRELARKRAHYVLRLLRTGNCRELVESSSTSTRPFFDLYVDFCDLVSRERPEDGHAYALHLPQLAERIPVGRDDVYHFRSPEEQAAYQVWAYAVLGQACSVAGRPEEAERAFESGRDRLPAPAWVEAELALRHGSHLVRSGALGGHEVVQRSLALWARAEARDPGPRAYFARAVLLELLAELAEHESGAALQLLEKAAEWSKSARLTPTLLPPYDFPSAIDSLA